MSSARPWSSKTSAQIIRKIDLKYGDHGNEKPEDAKEEVLASARRPSALSPTNEHPVQRFEDKPKLLKEEKTSVAKTLSSDSAISNDSSTGSSNLGLAGRQTAKPQFYFGQNVSSVVRSSPFFEQQPSAIEKVKKNEALSHPKLAKNEEPKIVAKEQANNNNNNHKGRFSSSGEVREQPNVIKVVRNKPQMVSPSLSSTVSSLSSPTSTSSSSSSSSLAKQRLQELNLKNLSKDQKELSTSSNDEEETFLVPRPKFPPNSSSSQHSGHSSKGRLPSSSSSTSTAAPAARKIIYDEPLDVRKAAFEAELVHSKSRLKKLSSGLGQTGRSSARPLASSVFADIPAVQSDEVGVPARPPPAPVPPPPPQSFSTLAAPRPPPIVSLKPVNGEIPQAPKLTHFGAPAEPQRKGLVAPNGLSARYLNSFLISKNISRPLL